MTLSSSGGHCPMKSPVLKWDSPSSVSVTLSLEAWQLSFWTVIAFGISFATASQRDMSLECAVREFQWTPYTEVLPSPHWGRRGWSVELSPSLTGTCAWCLSSLFSWHTLVLMCLCYHTLCRDRYWSYRVCIIRDSEFCKSTSLVGLVQC